MSTVISKWFETYYWIILFHPVIKSSIPCHFLIKRLVEFFIAEEKRHMSILFWSRWQKHVHIKHFANSFVKTKESNLKFVSNFCIDIVCTNKVIWTGENVGTNEKGFIQLNGLSSDYKGSRKFLKAVLLSMHGSAYPPLWKF